MKATKKKSSSVKDEDSKRKTKQNEDSILDAEPTEEFSNELLEICRTNGHKAEKLVDIEPNVFCLNLFQLVYLNSLTFLHRFRYLTELCVIQQKGVKSLSGLEHLSALQKLWVTQCSLKSIDNFYNNSELRELYLCGNFISDIPDIGNLTKLEKLWLCDNKIRKIENLENLHKLKTLYVSRNRIERVGDSLDGLRNLYELNLADNLIGCFKDILKLSRLSSLKNLCLRDPHYGDNPVCKLYNYQTFLLYHLSRLTNLDTMYISEDSKQLTEATYMKKRMYYNMRVKTIKRNTTNAIKRATEIRQCKTSRVNLSLNVVLRQKKDIDRELEEIEWYKENNKDDKLSDEKKKFIRSLIERQKYLQQNIDYKSQDIKLACSQFDCMKQDVCNTADESIRHLMLELETGGNIRLVEGKQEDAWFSSCVELLKSRFVESAYTNYGIKGIKVNRVLRIHNRFLRNRFDERVNEIVNPYNPEARYPPKRRKSEGNSDSKTRPEAQNAREQADPKKGQKKTNGRQLEYLFYVESNQANEDFLRTAEEGFRSVNEYTNLGYDHCGIPFWNCLTAQDLKGSDNNNNEKKKKQKDRKMKRRLIVTKVYLGNFIDKAKIPDKKHRNEDNKNTRNIRNGKSDIEESVNEAEANRSKANSSGVIDMDRNPLNRLEYHNAYVQLGKDLRHKKWLSFDKHLCLPEYLVDFEYEEADDVQMTGSISGSSLSKVRSSERQIAPNLSPQEAADLGPLHQPLKAFIDKMNTSEIVSDIKNDDFVETAKSNQLPSRQKHTSINDVAIRSWTRFDDITKLLYLNMHGNNIRSMNGLDACKSLKVLVLSFNELYKIEGLDHLVQLKRLELGFNLIKRIEGLEKLTQLDTLELNNNLIYRLEDLTTLQLNSPSLKHLNLRNNAICEVKNYESLVLQKLHKLVTFDSKPVTSQDIIKANESKVVINEALIRACGKGYSIQGQYSPTGSTNNELRDDEWWQQVESVEINHKHLRRLENLNRLTKLRSASFADNDLSRIEGLDNCLLLEELSFEENRILKIEGLSTLIFLKKIDLGKNKLKRLENLDYLSNLTQLSIEDNEIQSLEGLSKLKSLMELYIGNNKITNLKEIQHLKELGKLIILDLLGNPLCKRDSYRLYSVFYLRRLKVLDGVGVDAREQELAKKKYNGKLTSEFLHEKIGHKYYEHIRELDLSGCRIHEIELLSITGDLFCSLKEINLSNNNLTSLTGLVNLPNLQVLRLNYNRIESLEAEPLADESVTCSQSKEIQQKPLAVATECGLGAMPNLEVLQLGNNRITDIRALSLHRLPKLKVLFLQGNEITKINGLESCKELRELVLDKNKLRHLDDVHEALTNLTNLRALRLEENSIRTLGSFHSLVKLHSLYLGFNRITDMCELEKLSAIPLLLEISVSNNPVTRKQFYRPTILHNLPSLKYVDGKEITQEERERVEVLFSNGDNRSTTNAPFYANTGYSNAADHTSASGALAGKMPVKMQAMSFDTINGLGVVGVQTKHTQFAKQSLEIPDSKNSSNNGLPYGMNNNNNSLNIGSVGVDRSSEVSNLLPSVKRSHFALKRKSKVGTRKRFGSSSANSVKALNSIQPPSHQRNGRMTYSPR